MHKTVSKGLCCGVLAATLFSLMGTLLYQAHALDPGFSSIVGSFIRVLVNTALLFVPLSFLPRIPGENGRGIFADMRVPLWIWGILGGLTLSSYYTAIQRIGMGQASFLQATQGIFITLLTPYFTRQKNSAMVWFAIAGSSIGIYLLYSPSLNDGDSWGKILAIASGCFAGLAYVVLAYMGKNVSARSVSFYWCFMSFFLLLFLLAIHPATWPTHLSVWILLILAALLASLAQIFTTLAYQEARAAFVASITYLTPVISLVTDAIFFKIFPPPPAYLGACMIFICGVALPFLHSRSSLNMAEG